MSLGKQTLGKQIKPIPERNIKIPDRKIDLGELYQEVILEHVKRPRHKQKNLQCCYSQEGKNPSCGDNITVYCQTTHKDSAYKISLKFDGIGCSISQASASIMCEAIQNMDVLKAKEWIQKAEGIYTGKLLIDNDDITEDIEALGGVAKFPVRIKCAALPWKALEILCNQHFDEFGKPKHNCESPRDCPKQKAKKIRIVTTES